MSKLFTLFVFLLAIFAGADCYAQIWNYPPGIDKGTKPRTDSVFRQTCWKHEVVDGVETGKKELTIIREYNREGYLISETYPDSSKVLYDHYVQGFWQLRIDETKSHHRTFEFDSSGNIVRMTFGMAEVIYRYDSLNQVVQTVRGDVTRNWTYSGQHLVRFETWEGEKKESETIYYHDSASQTITYVEQFYDDKGEKYKTRDSTIGHMQGIASPLKLEYYTLKNDSITFAEIILVDTVQHTMRFESSTFCTVSSSQRNQAGSVGVFTAADCNGKVYRKETFEYEYYGTKP